MCHEKLQQFKLGDKAGTGMFRIAICEDEAGDKARLQEQLDAYAKQHPGLLSCCFYKEAAELEEVLLRQKTNFDAYFLDIMMPGKNGVELARQLKADNGAANIIFLSSVSDYVEESYAMGAVYYMLKPVQQDKLFALLDKLTVLPTQENMLVLQDGNRLHKVEPSNVIYVEAMGKRQRCHLASGEIYDSNGQFKDLAAQLLQLPYFIKAHRSVVVNMYYISDLKGTDLCLKNGEILPIARSVLKELRQRFLDFCFEGGTDG